MRTTRLLLGSTLSFLVLASAGASSASKDPSERKSMNACAAIRVTAPDAPQPKRKSRKRLPTFSASSILDLKLEAALSPAVKGQHQLEFKVYTPKGHLYQSLPATVAAAAAPSSDRRQRESPKRTATAMLPVAGTTIVTSSLYGEWRIEAYLDGERETACGRPLSFVIEP